MNYKRLALLSLISLLVIFQAVSALPARPWATGTITPIPTPRYEEILNYMGGNSTTTEGPNWGMILQSLIFVYGDKLGMVAYVILFSIPFIMMWIMNSDMTIPAIAGMIFSVYVFTMIPSEYVLFATGCFVICLTALAWSIYRRSY